jgi:Tol biopolymer transport system component/DNA-binding winged helix-turn-helix (wHTH) protein
MSIQTSFTFRFADIEVREPELRVIRSGEPLAIEPKAFRVLIYLLRHAGHLVPKEEILTAVWGDTAVTDNSLTRAIALLRRLLDDDPHTPRYIETVSTAGYRFICPVEAGLDAVVADHPARPDAMGAETTAPQTKGRISRRKLWIVVVAACFVLAIAAGLTWSLIRPLPPPRITEYVQLTRDGQQKWLVGTDGLNLYWNIREAAGLLPAQVPVGGGQTTPFAVNLPNVNEEKRYMTRLPSGGISPDGTQMLVMAGECCGESEDELWVVGTSGRSAHYLTKAWSAAWSPDSKQVVFSKQNGDLFTMPSEGGTPRLLLPAPTTGGSNVISFLNWSPDGQRIWFVRNPERKIWEIASDGSNLHRVFPGWDETHYVCCGQWTRDGDFYFLLAGLRSLPNGTNLQLWALDERHAWLKPDAKQPIQLADGPVAWGTPYPSPDGKKIFSVATSLRGELERFDKQSNRFLPYLGGISAEFVAFSSDGKYLAYVTFPEGVLWRSNPDGTGPVQLTSPPVHPVAIQWSPDGRQILFSAFALNNRSAIYVVSSQGGAPARLIPDDTESECIVGWFPNGKKVVYSTDCRMVGDLAPGKRETRILDLDNHETSALPPGPEAGWAPRMSPDGRYIAFLGAPIPSDPMIFDMQTQRYTVLRGLPPFRLLNCPRWSHDSKYVYFLHSREGGSSIYRVSVATGKAEQAVDLKNFRHTGWLSRWMGLDPTDTPLLLRDAGSMEVYALTLER